MDVLFLLIAIACVLVALFSTFATLGASRAAERIASNVIYGSCVAAFISVVLAVLFFFTWAH
jgi:hypothetical protein